MTGESASLALAEFTAKYQAYREACTVEDGALASKQLADAELNQATSSKNAADSDAQGALVALLAALAEVGITPE